MADAGKAPRKGGWVPGQKKKKRPAYYGPRTSTGKREVIEVKQLAARVQAEAPPLGSQEGTAAEFAELPISRYTQTGLFQCGFKRLTEIQKVAIPHALAGRDVMGAAKTGSGKTLAFVVPVLEALYRAQWSNEDGLGALIISPTRELAMQIMDVLRTVGSKHYSLSAGLVVGGHDFATEAATIAQMNVLVATPGRLLQHLEQTVAFDPSNLQVLVLDEADRCLDMGFADTMRGILDTLPKHPQRQTLLFSATQTKSIKALAGLSLADPQYVAVHAASDTVTPKQLLQTYVVLPLEDKLNLLYSFLRTHTKNKSIVFLSSCKQTRFVFEVFRRMRPGVPLLHLHGKMKQARRMHIYYDFLKKPAAALFATDIAARGLDFPAVDWVVQADCPEDVQAYIHRVGRTARFKARGNALLALTPREAEGMLPALQEAKIPLKQITVNPDQALAATPKVAAEVAADPELKYVAQRAFVSYVRSVLLQGNKAVFDVNALDLPALAASLGLPQPPRVKGLKSAAASAAAKAAKNAPRALAKLRAKIAAAKAAGKGGGAEEDDSSDSESAEGGPRAPPRRRRVGSPTHPQREVPHKLAARMALAGGLAGDSDSEGGEVRRRRMTCWCPRRVEGGVARRRGGVRAPPRGRPGRPPRPGGPAPI